MTSFEKLASFAGDDAALNRVLGTVLVEADLVERVEAEVGLSGAIELVSDLVVDQPHRKVRLEIMWRKKTGRAEIANYVLGKLQSYGRAVGYLA